MDKQFMTINNTCKASGLSSGFIRKLVAEKKIPHIKSGNRVLINYPLFIEFMNNQSIDKGATTNG